MSGLEIAALVCASIPAALFVRNLSAFRVAPRSTRRASVSVLIPARNEEASIAAAVESALANRDTDLEVIVLDDASNDSTAAIVHALSARDPRVRLETAPPLPAGWCGKQHACFALSRLAAKPLLCFMDADVRLSSDALGRMAQFQQETGAALVSGFPRQQVETPLERLLIPLIHFLLLGFLPVRQMRRSLNPAFGAGCGQLFFARADAYREVGGHGAVRATLHDGLTLPKAFRARGYATDIFDATDTAVCRMYRNAGEVWNGLAKNATEGLAAPARIVPMTALLFCGQVLPFVLAVAAPTPASLAAAALAWLPRLLAAARFRQPWDGAFLHPLSLTLLLVLQWYALIRKLTGASSSWKGRHYPATESS